MRLQGAKVLMTRTTETFVDNKDRILLYRDSLPDLLVSIHLNSSADPVHVGGTSTYYRHIGFRKLSEDIYKRMLQLGLKEWGNTGSFNFMLNSPTEYPNALVEMLFLSNPEEEAMILNDEFQQQVADKIVAGIKDFLGAGNKNEIRIHRRLCLGNSSPGECFYARVPYRNRKGRITAALFMVDSCYW